MSSSSSVRVDRWVWAVRLVKTRSLAAAACRAGHVTVRGQKAKPAESVRVGDEVRVRSGDIERIVTVTRLVTQRIGASVAVDCYLDLTPQQPPREERPATVTRDRGAGRPTKRERRDIERWLGR